MTDSPDKPSAPSPTGAPGSADPASRPHAASPRTLGETFARGLSEALSSLLARPATAALASVDEETFESFFHDLAEPTCCFPLRAGGESPRDTGRLVGWIELSPALAFLLIDRMLGGAGEGTYVPARPLSETERELLGKLLARAGETLCSLLGADGRADDAARPIGSESVAVLHFQARCGEPIGTAALCLPAAMLSGAEPADDRRRVGLIELSVALSEDAEDADALDDLQAGDILSTDEPADAEVTVRIGGIPKLIGKLRAGEGKRAVLITRRLTDPDGG